MDLRKHLKKIKKIKTKIVDLDSNLDRVKTAAYYNFKIEYCLINNLDNFQWQYLTRNTLSLICPMITTFLKEQFKIYTHYHIHQKNIKFSLAYIIIMLLFQLAKKYNFLIQIQRILTKNKISSLFHKFNFKIKYPILNLFLDKN